MTAVAPALRSIYPPLVKAFGGYFTLADGRRFLDISSQTMNMLLGQNCQAVTKAVFNQASSVQFASSRFGTQVFVDLSERLARMAPEGIDVAILKLTNGSDAVETAIKIAMLHTRRQRVGCLPGAWHGESFLTLGLATTHRGRLLADHSHVAVADAPNVAALKQLAASRRDLAAVVLDPALVSNGLPAEEIVGQLVELRAACDEAGTLLVFDEIQKFGWLGAHLFAAEATGVCPDVICLGKALGAGHPLAAVLCRTDLAAVLQYNDAEFTYGGHPWSCAAGLAALDVLEGLRDGLSARVAEFSNLLIELFSPSQYEVRQLGLIATVTLAEDRLREAWASRAAASCAEGGVFVRTTDVGRRLLIKPPIILTVEDLATGLGAMAEVSAESRERLRHASPATAAARTGVHLEGSIIRKMVRPNRHAGYVDALLRVSGPDLQAAVRSPLDQQKLTRRLADIGVQVASTYRVDGHEAVEYEYIPGRSLQDLMADPATHVSLINGLALRHYELIVRAHDHGIIIGDRWPGNAVVTDQAELRLIDFELGYDGPWHALALFEETFCVLQTIAAIHADHAIRDDLLARLVAAVISRHGSERTAEALLRLTEFYNNPARPVHDESASAEVYLAVLEPALASIEAGKHESSIDTNPEV